VLRQADLQRYLFLGGKGMFLCFYVKKIVSVDTLLELLTDIFFWLVFSWYFLVFTEPILEENSVGTFWYYFFGGNPFFPRKGGHGPLF
jgi:hypothetical protein